MTTSGRPSRLWNQALGSDYSTVDDGARDRFRVALDGSRNVAALLGGEIAGSLPGFTRHDLSHMEALWELADLIAGEDVRFNPAEAFVLGVAILVHDLAMSHASHIVTNSNLRQHRSWPDALARHLRRELGRAPYPAELASPPQDVANHVEAELLRDLHAEQAERLPLAEWTMMDGTRAYLISDPEIREGYGRLIGRIAASHHWDHELVSAEFATQAGALSFAPTAWKVDSLVLACLLRLADAAHLDAGRVPSVLAASRTLSIESRNHWVFQTRLQRPYISNSLLVFTAPAGFTKSEINAWWLAYDTCRMVNGELRQVDELLNRAGRQRFLARGVAHVDRPSEFRLDAACHGWEPVSASVQVSDVVGLVRRLGGVELYGQDSGAGLRELLTNACDAVGAMQALRAYRGLSRHSGRIDVELVELDDRQWIVVRDNGIGMSREFLATNLLDFGNSSWLSWASAVDNPGILASSFEPIGRYGIGFFACFMLGDSVRVVSRPRSGSPSDTHVLEFGDGLNGRPTLRLAEQAEQLEEPGTSVWVLIDANSTEECYEFSLEVNGGLGGTRYRANLTGLESIVPVLLPASPVDVWVRTSESNPKRIIQANDWMTIAGLELLSRVAPVSSADEKMVDGMRILADSLAPISSSSGEIIGRAALVGDYAKYGVNWAASHLSIVTAGPARTSTGVHGLAGLMIGAPCRAARDGAIPLATVAEIGEWATRETRSLLDRYGNAGTDWLRELIGAVTELGGDASEIRGWRTTDGWFTFSELREWLQAREAIWLAHPVYESVRVGDHTEGVDLVDNVVLWEQGRRLALRAGGLTWPLVDTDMEFNRFGSPGSFAKCLSEAWGLPFDDVVEMLGSDSYVEDFELGRFGKLEVTGTVLAFSRP